MSLIGPRRALLVGTPGWVLPGSSVDMDFAHSQAWAGGQIAPITSLLTTVRASTGYAQTSSGLLVPFAANAPRITDQGLLVEEARTNVVLWDRDLTNAAWAKTNITAALNQAGADGAANSASSLTATAGNGTVLQAITLASSARFQSAYVKRLTGTGVINMTMDNGATWTAISVTAAYTKLTIPTQTLASPTVGFQIVTSGDAIAVDFVQNENGTFATSPIPTTTVAVTRAADSVNLTTAAGSVISSLQGSLRVETFALQQDGYIVSIDSTNSRFIRSSAASQMHSDFTGTLLTASAGSGNRSGSMKTSIGWNASGRSLVVNNGTLTSDSAVPSSLSASGVYLGSNTGVNGYGDGYIKRITAWTSRLSDAQLQALTQ